MRPPEPPVQRPPVEQHVRTLAGMRRDQLFLGQYGERGADRVAADREPASQLHLPGKLCTTPYDAGLDLPREHPCDPLVFQGDPPHHRNCSTCTISIIGAYSRMMSIALRWFSSVDPAHASSTTWTCTPASTAASAVLITQQSVVTPPRTSRPSAADASSGPHFPKEILSRVGAPLNSSTSSYSVASGGCNAKGNSW